MTSYSEIQQSQSIFGKGMCMSLFGSIALISKGYIYLIVTQDVKMACPEAGQHHSWIFWGSQNSMAQSGVHVTVDASSTQMRKHIWKTEENSQCLDL